MWIIWIYILYFTAVDSQKSALKVLIEFHVMTFACTHSPYSPIKLLFLKGFKKESFILLHDSSLISLNIDIYLQ